MFLWQSVFPSPPPFTSLRLLIRDWSSTLHWVFTLSRLFKKKHSGQTDAHQKASWPSVKLWWPTAGPTGWEPFFHWCWSHDEVKHQKRSSGRRLREDSEKTQREDSERSLRERTQKRLGEKFKQFSVFQTDVRSDVCPQCERSLHVWAQQLLSVNQLCHPSRREPVIHDYTSRLLIISKAQFNCCNLITVFCLDLHCWDVV